jgi:hypothetical protein
MQLPKMASLHDHYDQIAQQQKPYDAQALFATAADSTIF